MKAYEWHKVVVNNGTNYNNIVLRYLKTLETKIYNRYMIGLIENYTFHDSNTELEEQVKHYHNRKEFQDAVIYKGRILNLDIMYTQLNDIKLIESKTCAICFKTLFQGPNVYYCDRIWSICGKCKRKKIQRHHNYPILYVYIKELNICKVFLLFRTLLV